MGVQGLPKLYAHEGGKKSCAMNLRVGSDNRNMHVGVDGFSWLHKIIQHIEVARDFHCCPRYSVKQHLF
jgi:hypothetical protein